MLILTARTPTVDTVVDLKLGADDPVTEPFASMEALARIETLLRRVPIRTGQGIVELGPLLWTRGTWR
jgi:two-component system copper resistance phosphate regulon response regulator CusR